jgi:hypothetical protein
MTKIDPKRLLSGLWLFAILNYLYCDVFGLMDASLLRQFLDGTVNGMEVSPEFLLGASVLMEVPIAMVLLSRWLPFRLNRTLNIGAGTLMTVVQLTSLFVGQPTIYYLFFSAIEISATISIVWIAMRWQQSMIPHETVYHNPA